MNYLSRLAEKRLLEKIPHPEVLTVLGARQVGKTTLVNHCLQNKRTMTLNLDFLTDRQYLENLGTLDAPKVLNTIRDIEVLIIDEAQNFPATGQIVKGWYDKKLPFKVILLGSSSLDLLDQTAEPLTGRNEKIFLTPFMFTEVLRQQAWFTDTENSSSHLLESFDPTIQTLLLEHMVYGGYPKLPVVTNKEEYLSLLVSDYLLKDTLQTGEIKDPQQVQKILLLLAHQVGSEVSINEISNGLNIPRATVERTLDLLERSFVIFRLTAFGRNKRNEVLNNRKIYFWDTGVRNTLLREFSLSSSRSDIGALWENLIISEVMKWNVLSGSLHNVEFWRSRGGSEVDIVIRHNEEMSAFEIKWSKEKPSGGWGFEAEYHTPIRVLNRHTAIDFLVNLQLKNEIAR